VSCKNINYYLKKKKKLSINKIYDEILMNTILLFVWLLMSNKVHINNMYLIWAKIALLYKICALNKTHNYFCYYITSTSTIYYMLHCKI
jgi:hypothetical protein